MNIVKCVNGHFYDSDKTTECPECKKKKSEMTGADFDVSTFHRAEGRGRQGEQRFYNGISGQIDNSSPENTDMSHILNSSGSTGDTEGKTVGIFSTERRSGYIVGWIVGIKGPVRGYDYRIRSGKNWIGRSYTMDIVIAEGDRSMEEKQHCAIVYDGKWNRFYLLPGNGTITYLNNQVLSDPKEIKLRDRIRMGNCFFVFIPFCIEGCKWDEGDLAEN